MPTPKAYYNEWDAKAAAWLRVLIKEGLIADGDVDTRSIREVRPSDLEGYTQHHFFAGIGGWSLALRLAGCPDSLVCASASLPCQPFSVGSVAHGGAKGQEDDRHLLPDFLDLTGECEFPVIFGEQVAPAIRWGWLDEAFGGLEKLGYACGAAVLPTLAVGGRHERKRLHWLAYSSSARRQGHQPFASLPGAAGETFSINGDALVRAGYALDGDLSGLLPSNGVSLQLERDALKGYGNAINPVLAAHFIQASIEAMRC